MRRAALLLPLLFLLPTALAAQTYNHYYAMGGGNGCAGGNGGLIRNCVTYAPAYGQSSMTVTVEDVSGDTVRVRVCHEWSYDDGSHVRLRCTSACSPTKTEPLDYPPWPWNTSYRVLVDLRGGPGACEVAATAGKMKTVFS